MAQEEILAWLIKHKSGTIKQIAKGTKLSQHTIPGSISELDKKVGIEITRR